MFDRFSLMEEAYQEVEEGWRRIEEDRGGLEEDWRCLNWLKIAKNYVSRFFNFSPLYRRFRLSRVFRTIDIEEIYRLVSKILNFKPCGSVFGRSRVP